MTDLHLPDFDLPGVAMAVSTWHAAIGQRLVEGDRVLEVTAGEVTIDVAAPVSGILAERCVTIDELLTVGQLLARIRPE